MVVYAAAARAFAAAVAVMAYDAVARDAFAAAVAVMAYDAAERFM